ncbi:MAG TPA: hypothetical protein VN922_24625 [Bacteroidia bacterium]|nr:hypothetical protein [Bacteroidia bacterium]
MKKIKNISDYTVLGYTEDEQREFRERESAARRVKGGRVNIGKFTSFGGFKDLRSL